MKSKLIIWDWNGTLLNDIDACVDSMNIMLSRRKMKRITTDYYKSVFTFPVQKYYEQLGFNFEKESFEELSVEYIDLYKEASQNAPLQIGSVDVLESFKRADHKQIILSASEQIALETQVKERDISQFFHSLLGLNNIHAKSKVNNAINYIEKWNIKGDEIILIGDTYHDYEVAQALGCRSILINKGHQDLNQFDFDHSNMVIDDFSELVRILELN
ncbi:MAG: HAD hydrolase-like protein [Bacteroidetes bacterium]|nr:HAD hydrolase-like protein [Bacteroidota bacterium]